MGRNRPQTKGQRHCEGIYSPGKHVTQRHVVFGAAFVAGADGSDLALQPFAVQNFLLTGLVGHGEQRVQKSLYMKRKQLRLCPGWEIPKWGSNSLLP